MNPHEHINSILTYIKQERLSRPTRNPGISALLSFVIMGCGQIYSGAIEKGLILITIHFVTILLVYSYTFSGVVYQFLYSIPNKILSFIIIYIYTLFYIILWIYNIKDAYKLALIADARDLFSLQHNLLLPLYNNNSNIYLEFENYNLVPNKKTIIALYTIIALIFLILFITSLHYKNSLKFRYNNNLENQIQLSNSNTLSTATLTSVLGDKIDKTNNYSINQDKIQLATYSLYSLLTCINESKNDKYPPEVLQEDPFIAFYEMLDKNNIASCVEILEETSQVNLKAAKILWLKVLSNIENKIVTSNTISTDTFYNLIENYLKYFPDDANKLLKLAKYQFISNNHTIALQNLIKVLRQDPTNLEANFLIASIYYKMSLYNDAIPYIDNLLKLDPLNSNYLKLAIYIFTALDDIKKAENLLQKLVIVNTNLGIVDDETNFLQELISRHKNTLSSGIATNKIDFINLNFMQNTEFSENNNISKSKLNVNSSKGAILYEAKDNDSDEHNGFSTNLLKYNSTEKFVSNTPSNYQLEEKSLLILEKNNTSNNKNNNEVIQNKLVTYNNPKELRQIDNQTTKSSEISIEKAKILSSDNNTFYKPPTLEIITTSSNEFSYNNNSEIVINNNLEKNTSDDLSVRQDSFKNLSFWDRGLQNFVNGRFEDALEDFLNFVKDNPTSHGYEMIGLVFEKIGMLEDAYKAYLLSYKMGKRTLNFMVKLAKLAEHQGDYQAAYNYISEIYSKHPQKKLLRDKLEYYSQKIKFNLQVSSQSAIIDSRKLAE